MAILDPPLLSPPANEVAGRYCFHRCASVHRGEEEWIRVCVCSRGKWVGTGVCLFMGEGGKYPLPGSEYHSGG